MNAARAARIVAILIAIAAFIDPAVPLTRPSRPVVAVVAATPADSVLAERVRARLRDTFTVLDAAFGGADATVLVGDRLTVRSRAPVFAVLPGSSAPGVRIESVRVPDRVALESAASVTVQALVTAAAGDTVTLSLMDGALELDRLERVAAGGDERFETRVAWIPVDTGATRLRVTARVGSRASTADLLADPDNRRLSVLFHDARPSWLSTFVRRAVERDARFDVVSRIITSNDISIDAGRPPSIADTRSIPRFDAVVVGAPESLSSGEIAALDAYMRVRGGAVVLLFDRDADGPWRRLAGVNDWITETIDAGAGIDRVRAVARDAAPPALRVTQLLSPARLPAGASVVAAREGGDAKPVVWRSAVGAGRLIASGAVDAWRFRDAADSRFDAFWPALIADAAAASPPVVDVRIADSVVSPGETIGVDVTLRDIALATHAAGDTVAATVRAALDGPGGTRDLRLWPAGDAGSFRAGVRAPNDPGTYRVIVSYGEAEGSAAFVVAADAARASPREADLVAGWARAHGGEAFGEDGLALLQAALLATVEPEPRRIIARPMRSPWWIVPFVLALGAEWWWRRRRGLS